jgi:hypothetical protein
MAATQPNRSILFKNPTSLATNKSFKDLVPNRMDQSFEKGLKIFESFGFDLVLAIPLDILLAGLAFH